MILSLAAAVFVSAAAAAPPAGQADGKGANADAYVNAFEKCQSGKLDLLASDSREFLRIAEPPVQALLTVHAACLGAVPGHEQSCDAVRPLERGFARCRELVQLGEILAGVAYGRGDALAACQKFQPTEDADRLAKMKAKRNEAGHARRCVFLVEQLKGGRGGDICAKAVAANLFEKKEGVELCRQKLVYFDGDPEKCKADPDTHEWPYCRERAALVAAVKARDCSGSAWCTALAKQSPASCESYLLRASKAFCDRAAEAAEPILKAKADREAKLREDQAKVKVFKKGAPMQSMPPDVEKAMKRIEQRGKLPPSKPFGKQPEVKQPAPAQTEQQPNGRDADQPLPDGPPSSNRR